MPDRVTAIYVTYLVPSDVGNGGAHRAYQVLHDLRQALGEENVVLFSEILWWRARDEAGRPTGARRIASSLSNRMRAKHVRLARYAENPLNVLFGTQFSTRGVYTPLAADYENLIKTLPRPLVCVIDHACFADLLKINRRHGVPTISCAQNLDSLSENFSILSDNLGAFGPDGAGRGKSRWRVYAATTDFANELRVLSQCSERLAISKTEASIIGGLGLSAHYYPYRPVKAIRQRMEAIRLRRSQTSRRPGLFLMIGSSFYGPIGRSCEWLLKKVTAHGLPGDSRLVVVGRGMDKLLAPGTVAPNVEVRGWVEQEELEHLLVDAVAALVPQQFGFGANTRLTELSCAGVPAVVSRHSTYSVDVPPGLRVVGNSWEEWRSAIEQLGGAGDEHPPDSYYRWEAAQANPLSDVILKSLAC